MQSLVQSLLHYSGDWPKLSSRREWTRDTDQEHVSGREWFSQLGGAAEKKIYAIKKGTHGSFTTPFICPRKPLALACIEVWVGRGGSTKLHSTFRTCPALPDQLWLTGEEVVL